MIQLIAGKKGKGKTKYLLDKANQAIKTSTGNIVYLDKSVKHMYELNTKVRLINAMEFQMKNGDEFIGFILGILSQDHDIEQMYLDSFLKISHLEGEDVTGTLDRLGKVGEAYEVSFVISISLDESELPEKYKENVIVSL